SDQRFLAWLVGAAQLSTPTDVPAEAFYGWSRTEPSLPPEWEQLRGTRSAAEAGEVLNAIRSHLIAAPDQQLQQALLAAIDRNVIPAALRDQIDELIRRLKRSALTMHIALARLVDERSGDALAGVDVQ